MTMQVKTAIVFGGTGFIGRQIVRELAAKGYRVKVATRVPERAYFLKPYGAVGQIVPVHCDYRDPQSITNVIAGCDYVVNTIGVLYQRGKAKFKKIHTELPVHIAQACQELGVAKFVHISALGCETGRSKYAKSKAEGEAQIREIFPEAIILRPSVVFGPDDDFFNKFAELARYVPFLPLIGGGTTKFQPVYVGDVADAVMQVLETLELGEGNPCGKVYELGGPDVLTFREIYKLLEKYTGKKRALMPVPYPVAKLQALFLGVLPNPLLTPDQVESLKTDNVVEDTAFTLADLGIHPTSMVSILPQYLERYRSGGKYAGKLEAGKPA
jgi:uncharacterized protein YbjT (DUF2867 family)